MKIPILLDPFHKYPEYTPEQIVALLGLIPQFMVAVMEGLRIDPSASFIALTQEAYGYPMDHNSRAKIVLDVYRYPGDPDMYPLVKYLFADMYVLQYPYGCMAFIQRDNVYICCMD